MKGKKTFWFATTSFLVLIMIVSVIGIKHHETVKAKEEQEEARKVALEREQSLEQNARSAVNRLFASDKLLMLNDNYSEDLNKKAQQLIGQLKNKKMKADLEKKRLRAEKFEKEVELSKQNVAALFTDETKRSLAQHVTKDKLDGVKQAVLNSTPQAKTKLELKRDVEKAYQLLASQEKARKVAIKKAQEKMAAKKQEQSVASRKVEPSSGDSNRQEKNRTFSSQEKSPVLKQNESEQKESPSSKAPQPIVAKMNLAARTSQIITVVASGTSAQVSFWEKSGGAWNQVFKTYGQVGAEGVGSADEYHSRTPRGAYSLGFAFGTSNPGTSLSFRQITNNSYWISNVNDSQYNTWQERESSSGSDEHMASFPTQYQYGVVINYNTARTKGAGSGFFLHCSNGAPTAGCVSIPTSQMKMVLQKLHGSAYIVNVTSEQELLNY
ncbi:hypothetical protein X560_2480 [Listeria fleischmannii 1991]|uniref:L,D-TPase catalytic domain-containing protein n=1 Tax=Listeria fleischmannii 1991 TaxID=1430899 RepID=A0A0J8GB38_9LIST|nr:toxin Cry1Ac domain D-VI-related protein [Listeria fleischmannii]EMG28447.1 S-layer domain-containing protein [Listeria fleischmannii subsp. fleischmannii LU2006-1]KMT58039.1 hypothetical protein X560_2480 [Listeria fleischmannii 1991]